MASSLRRSTKSANPQSLLLSPLAIINDDEAERQASRAQTSDNDVSASASDREGLADCLKIVNANKITKENVWSLSLIDNFSRLLNRHHKSVQNFQVAGSTLEASSRIYGVRVDSVHNDVMHMATGLIGMEVPLNTGIRVSSNDAQSNATAPARRARKKTQISTVTRNKDTINNKLDTICLTEPTFAKLNSVVGDINSSHRLLNFLLPTMRSELIHFSKHPFWDSTEYPNVLFEQSVDYACMPSSVTKNMITLSADLTLRRHVAVQSYRITDIPAVDTEDTRELSPIDDNYDDFDANNFEMAFDVNADVEPVPEMLVDNEFPNDLRPLDSLSKTLEYSYRPMDRIGDYWAGPSYWKILKTVHDKTTDKNQTSRKTPGRRKKHQPIDVTAPYDKSLFISTTSRQGKKLDKRKTQKNWNAKGLRLPVNHNIPPDYFDHYQYAGGLVKWCPSIENDTPPIRPSDQSNNIQADDHHNDDDDMSDHLEAGPSQPFAEQTPNTTVTEITTKFENEPEKVALIDIPFAKRNKVIDMKQLKRCCWSTIVKQCSDYQRGAVASDALVHNDSEVTTFKKVCASTPNLLSKSMQEIISPAVTFLSILHLASEHSLRLITDTDVSDFLIIRDNKAKSASNQK